MCNYKFFFHNNGVKIPFYDCFIISLAWYYIFKGDFTCIKQTSGNYYISFKNNKILKRPTANELNDNIA